MPLFISRVLKQPTWLLLVCGAVVGTALAGVALGMRAGWYPFFDDAYDALAVLDIGRGHFPLLGSQSTSLNQSPVDLHHPGPLYWYALYPMTALFGGSPLGLMLGQALIAIVCFVGAIVVARRVAGPRLAIATAFVCLLDVFAIGPAMLYRPFIPYGSVLPTALCFFAAWGVAQGRLQFLPWFLAGSALASQAHASGLVLSAVWAVSLSAILGLRVLLYGWRRAFVRRDGSIRRQLMISAVVLVLLWLPVGIEAAVGNPSNIHQLFAYVTTGKTPGVGWGVVATSIAYLMNPWPPSHITAISLSQQGIVGTLREHTGWLASGLALALVVAAIMLALRTSRTSQLRLPRLMRRWPLGVGLLLVGLAGQSVALAGLDASALSLSWEFVHVWPLIHLLWALVVVMIVTLYRERFVTSVEKAQRKKLRLRIAALALPGAVLATMTSPIAADYSYGRTAREVAPQLVATVAKVSGRPPSQTHVVVQGDTIGTDWGYGWALSYALLQAGYTPHMSVFGQLRQDWEYRHFRTAPADSLRVYILDNPETSAKEIPPGAGPSFALPDPGDGVAPQVFVLPPPPRSSVPS